MCVNRCPAGRLQKKKEEVIIIIIPEFRFDIEEGGAVVKSDESPLVDHLVCDLEGDFGIAGADEGEQAVTVLADEWFLVIATNIVPFDSVVVEVVQDGQARLSLL